MNAKEYDCWWFLRRGWLFHCNTAPNTPATAATTDCCCCCTRATPRSECGREGREDREDRIQHPKPRKIAEEIINWLPAARCLPNRCSRSVAQRLCGCLCVRANEERYSTMDGCNNDGRRGRGGDPTRRGNVVAAAEQWSGYKEDINTDL